MALPTAQTPGYTTYSGKVSCVCLAAWLPWLERLSLAHGYIKYRLDVLQLTGNYALSGGTHYGGGVYDIKQYDTRIAMLSREMGAPATWLRNMLYADGSPGNTHTHGVLSGCPHLSSGARWQITEQKAGRDGFASPHPDPLPDPSVYRTWSQGITWAKSELVRITGQNIIDNLETVMALSDADKAWLTAQFAKMPWTYKNPDTTRDAYDYLRNPGLDVWDENFVPRDGVKVSMKQEVADIKTQGIATAGAVTALSAKFDTLKDGVANLVTLIQESHPKPDPDPEPAPLPVPATQWGVDVSGWQTVERVDAVAADPHYGYVIVKASQGMSSGNASHDAQVAEARQGSKCVGHYHFAECDQDPIKELDNFLARAKVQPGDIVALDAEDWDQKDHPERMANTPWTQRLDFVLRWLEEAERRLGVRPLVYVNWNWIKGLRTAATQEQWERLTRYDCWIAQWLLGGAPIKPGAFEHINDKDGSPDGWLVAIHQWTNNDGGLDGNYMPDVNAWAKYALPRP